MTFKNRLEDGLHKIAHAVFKSETRANVGSLMFSSGQRMSVPVLS
jgi:hypothetical protein